MREHLLRKDPASAERHRVGTRSRRSTHPRPPLLNLANDRVDTLPADRDRDGLGHALRRRDLGQPCISSCARARRDSSGPAYNALKDLRSSHSVGCGSRREARKLKGARMSIAIARSKAGATQTET